MEYTVIKVYEFEPGLWTAELGSTSKCGSSPKEAVEILLEYLGDDLGETE